MNYRCLRCGVELDDFMGRETWSKTRVGAFCPAHYWQFMEQRQEKRQQERRAKLRHNLRDYPALQDLV